MKPDYNTLLDLILLEIKANKTASFKQSSKIKDLCAAVNIDQLGFIEALKYLSDEQYITEGYTGNQYLLTAKGEIALRDGFVKNHKTRKSKARWERAKNYWVFVGPVFGAITWEGLKALYNLAVVIFK